MFTVFITGPLAAGKQLACQYLVRTRGFHHIDLDVMAKELYDKPGVRNKVVKAYGSDILDEEGKIDKKILAERAFSADGDSEPLNSIIWPLVDLRLVDLLLGGFKQKDFTHENVVVEIPMLAEVPHLGDIANIVICVTADPEVRIQRAVERGMLREDALNRLALQASDEDRNPLCDIVIENNGTIEEFEAKLEEVLKEML